MNWMKVKIILIIFFLIINTLLIGILVSRNYDAVPDSDGIAGDVYEILKSRDITVDRDMISTESSVSETADAYPVSSRESAFLKNIDQKAEKTEDGRFVYNGSVIEIFENLVHLDSTDGLYSDPETYFKSVGIDFSGAQLISSEGNDTEGSFVYCETYDGIEIFGTKATVRKSGGIILSADITWYEISGIRSPELKTISFADALLDFAADKSRGNKPCTIIDIARGFSVDAGVENASVSQMVPSIRVTTAIGSSFYYDARSPE